MIGHRKPAPTRLIPTKEVCRMKQTWDSDTIDSMIERIEKLETDVKNLVAAGDNLAGCSPSENDWHKSRLAWDTAKSTTA